MTTPNSQNMCMLIWDEANDLEILVDKPVVEEVVVDGHDATRQRCAKCAWSLLRLKDTDNNHIFLEKPASADDKKCPYPYALALAEREKYSPVATNESVTQSVKY